MPLAAIVMARAPRPGGCNPGLEPLLGAEGCAALQTVLIRRAAGWAREVAGRDGHAAVACDPPEEREAVAGLAPGLELWAASDPAAALMTAFERFGGPVLVATTDMPRLGREHAAAALLDLDEGTDLVIGPAHDGGWYLLGVREPRPEAIAGPMVAECLRAAHELGLEVGLLRMERDLATPQDAAALLADPLLPGEVRAALGCVR